MIINRYNYLSVFLILGISFIIFSCNKDNTQPVITLIGGNPIDHCIDTPYVDAGVTAVDDQDGDITGNVNVVSNVLVSQTGSYTVNYTVKDKAGNTAVAVRTVNVIYCK
jgi:hypothetical protein